jgi:hypothetical protein
VPTLLRKSKPTARKPQGCSCCPAVIPVGTTYRRETFVYDGYVYDWKTCPACEGLDGPVFAWSTAMWHEGVGPDDYFEWASDHQNDPVHGEKARSYLARAGAA